MPEYSDEDLALEHALHQLDISREGVLEFAQQRMPIRFVIDGETGRLIASIPAAALLAVDAVLHIPEETDDALQLQLSIEEAAEGAVTDHWQAHHGQPEHVRWGELTIDAAKHGPWVLDGDAMMTPNPVRTQEAALCKVLNADKAKLAALCQRHAGVVVPDPTCVGVDGSGIMVRAGFGTVRVFFEHPAPDADTARSEMEALLASS